MESQERLKKKTPFNLIEFILIYIGKIKNPQEENPNPKHTYCNEPSDKMITICIDIIEASHDGYCSGADFEGRWKKEEKDLEITIPISALPPCFKHYSDPNKLSKSLCNKINYFPCGEKKPRKPRISYDSLSKCGWFENFERELTCCNRRESGYCGYASYSDLYFVRYIEFDGVSVHRPR